MQYRHSQSEAKLTIPQISKSKYDKISITKTSFQKIKKKIGKKYDGVIEINVGLMAMASCNDIVTYMFLYLYILGFTG